MDKNPKINPLCYSDYKTFTFAKLDTEEREREREKLKSDYDEMINQILKRQKENDSKPYIFLK